MFSPHWKRSYLKPIEQKLVNCFLILICSVWRVDGMITISELKILVFYFLIYKVSVNMVFKYL